nr:hypothetical protein CFP56_46694 [Quercus suber]
MLTAVKCGMVAKTMLDSWERLHVDRLVAATVNLYTALLRACKSVKIVSACTKLRRSDVEGCRFRRFTEDSTITGHNFKECMHCLHMASFSANSFQMCLSSDPAFNRQRLVEVYDPSSIVNTNIRQVVEGRKPRLATSNTMGVAETRRSAVFTVFVLIEHNPWTKSSKNLFLRSSGICRATRQIMARSY